MTRERLGPRVPTPLRDDGRTDQTHKGETDINRIIAQYVQTGALSHLNARTPLYGDFSEAADYHTQLNRVHEVQDVFASLSAKVRAMADNDPERFLEMVSIPEQLAALEEAGLVFSDDAPPHPTVSSNPPAEPAAPPALPPEGDS